MIRFRAIGVTYLILVALSAATVRAQCSGDCNDDGQVTVDEVIRGVNIALGLAAVSTCTASDINGDGEVTINELISSVNNALVGCSGVPRTPTPTRTVTPTFGSPTATPVPIPGCDSGDITAILSAPVDTNAELSPARLTIAAAAQVRDPNTGLYVWAITGNTCEAPGQLRRGVQIGIIGARSGFAPGRYPITPPLGTMTYVETPNVGIPQPRIWQTTGATLVIDSVSGGALTFHVEPAPMRPNLIVAGNPPPRGTFNLEVTGRVNQFTSN